MRRGGECRRERKVCVNLLKGLLLQTVSQSSWHTPEEEVHADHLGEAVANAPFPPYHALFAPRMESGNTRRGRRVRDSTSD